MKNRMSKLTVVIGMCVIFLLIGSMTAAQDMDKAFENADKWLWGKEKQPQQPAPQPTPPPVQTAPQQQVQPQPSQPENTVQPPVQTASPAPATKIVKNSGLTFEVIRCSRHEYGISCNFKVTSERDFAEWFWVSQSCSLYDEFGNNFFFSYKNFGGESSNASYQRGA